MAEEDETATARYITGHVSTQLMLKMMLDIITTIMTVPANTLLVPIQDRMPTILKRAGIPDWMRAVLKACSSGLSDMRTFVLIVEKLTRNPS
jgi:putative SOS response-associated peptidase YedK